jgi:predicted RNase H-like nuclease (RuvC/YqgF family)
VKSDFEKLVIARRYIEVLEKENELLKKEVESEHRLVEEANKAVKEELMRKEKMSPEEKLRIKSDLYVQQMRDTITNLKTKLKATTAENKKLVEQLIRLKDSKQR